MDQTEALLFPEPHPSRGVVPRENTLLFPSVSEIKALDKAMTMSTAHSYSGIHNRVSFAPHSYSWKLNELNNIS